MPGVSLPAAWLNPAPGPQMPARDMPAHRPPPSVLRDSWGIRSFVTLAERPHSSPGRRIRFLSAASCLKAWNRPQSFSSH